jgi:hypothetical protein
MGAELLFQKTNLPDLSQNYLIRDLTLIINANKLEFVFQYALINISGAETRVEFVFKAQNQAKLD